MSSRIQPRGRLRSIARRSRQAASDRVRRVRPGSRPRRPLSRCQASSGFTVKLCASPSAPSSSASHARRPSLSSCSSRLAFSGSRYRTSSSAYSTCSMGKRTPRPVRSSVGLRKLGTEPSFNELAIADLCRKARERRGDLGVENRSNEPRNREEHFDVLSRCVHHFDRRFAARQHGNKRRERHLRERVDARGIACRGRLNEAQLRTVSPFAEELRIKRDGWRRLQAGGPVGKRGGCGNDVLQRARRRVCTIGRAHSMRDRARSRT